MLLNTINSHIIIHVAICIMYIINRSHDEHQLHMAIELNIPAIYDILLSFIIFIHIYAFYIYT